MSAPLRVLFVSKPVVPPWHDGSKNLVRDVATHLRRARATVLTTPGAPPLGPHVTAEPVYKDAGRFRPSWLANARVLARLVAGDPHDLWHFVFAPNPASSAAARIAITARRAAGFRGPIVQTVASAPARFEGAARWLFGDHVVALSEHTRGRLFAAGAEADRVSVIPPCAAAPRPVTESEVQALRAELGLGGGPVALYPGDYEVSTGAQTVARAVPALVRAVPGATVVFACRPKTPRAAAARAEVEAALRAAGALAATRHVGEVRDMAVLLAAATCVLFPVDDLYGKVDVPLVLLEALALGVPLVVARGGPLEALTSAEAVEPEDAPGLAAAATRLLRGGPAVAAQREAGRALYRASFRPEVVAGRYEELYASLVTRRAR